MKNRQAVAVVGAVLLWGLTAERPQSLGDQRAGVRVAPAAAAGGLAIESCRVHPKRFAVLACPQTGILARVAFEEGNRVETGEIVAKLDDRVAQVRLKIAENEAASDVQVRAAEKAAQVAKVEYDQALSANRRFSGAVSDLEVGRLRLTAEQSVLQMEFARQQIELATLREDQAQAELDSLHIRAPFDGIVTKIYKVQGEAVKPGDPVLELVDTSEVRLEGYVSLDDVGRIEPGSPVEVTLASGVESSGGPYGPFFGEIVFVDVGVEPVSGKVRVWAVVPNPHNILRSGMTADLQVRSKPTAERPSVTSR